jgi:hypothetical protein
VPPFCLPVCQMEITRGRDQEREADEVQEAAGESEDSEEAEEKKTPDDTVEADAPEEQVGETQVAESRYPRRQRRSPTSWWSASVARAETRSAHDSRAGPSSPALA